MRKWIIIIVLVIVGCTYIPRLLPHNEWVTTTEGGKIWIQKDSKDAIYSWQGSVIAGLADGEGILTVNSENTKSKKKVRFTQGALQNAGWKETKKGSFLGVTKHNRPFGFGVLKNKNDIYIGWFDKHGLQGSGRRFDGHDLVYSGLFTDTKYCGFGTLCNKGKIVYIGKFKDNAYDGSGVEFRNGDLLYKGGFKKGKYNGKGQLFHYGRLVYSGMFKHGEYSGYGLQYKDGFLVYKGQFQHGKYDGKGALFQNGVFRNGKWKDGYPTEGFWKEQTKAFTGMWEHMPWKDKTQGAEDTQALTERANGDNDGRYLLDKEEYKEFVADLLDDYISNQVEETVKKRTSFWSWQPLRMFWQSLFTNKSKRIDGWFNAFVDNGLSRNDIEFFVNSFIADYNNQNINTTKLKLVQLNELSKDKIINQKTFDMVNAMEHAGWANNFWFDALLTYILFFMITNILSLFFLPAAPVLKLVDIIAGVVAALVGIILMLAGGDLEGTVINTITHNYVTVLMHQNIFY